MIFSNEIIDIPEEMKITLLRLNDGNTSPYERVEWNLSAKSVEDTKGSGIYGVWEEQLKYYGSEYFSSMLLVHIKNNPVVLKLEADKRDIDLINGGEIAVSKCNIVDVFDINDFAGMYPIFSNLIYWASIEKEELTPQSFSNARENAYSDTFQMFKFKSSQALFDRKSPIHGYSHFLRVKHNILLLGNSYKLEQSNLELFAFYHDILRFNDGDDPDHGKRGSELFKKNTELNIQKKRGLFISQEMIEKICFACENHTTMLRSGDKLIDICFDADRLDLMRIGVKPDPSKMATHIGAHYAENYEVYVSDVQKLFK